MFYNTLNNEYFVDSINNNKFYKDFLSPYKSCVIVEQQQIENNSNFTEWLRNSFSGDCFEVNSDDKPFMLPRKIKYKDSIFDKNISENNTI